MKPEERKKVIEAARKKYAEMLEANPLLAELQRRFNLRIDVEAEAAAEQPVEAGEPEAPPT